MALKLFVHKKTLQPHLPGGGRQLSDGLKKPNINPAAYYFLGKPPDIVVFMGMGTS
jgi:hypothetical protein